MRCVNYNTQRISCQVNMSMYTIAHYPLDPALINWALFQTRIEPKRLLGKRTTGWHSEYRYTVEAAGPFRAVLTHILSRYPDMLLDRWWINVCAPQEETFEHYHGDNMTSIVYYVQVPAMSGQIEFQNELKEWIGYQPEPGDIIAFDGMILHRVQPNMSKDMRISVGINLQTHAEFQRTVKSRKTNLIPEVYPPAQDEWAKRQQQLAIDAINASRPKGTL